MTNKMKIGWLTAGFVTGWIGVLSANAQCCGTCQAADEQKAPAAGQTAQTELKAQTTCPVMGNPINKATYVDVKGYRIYVCCKGCVEKVKADPDKYLAILKAKGEMAEKLPEPKSEAPAPVKPSEDKS